VNAESLLRPEDGHDLVGRATWLDVRWELGRTDGHEDYLTGHVPGAAYVDLPTDLADPPGDGGRHPLPDVDRFGAAMRRCGVRRDRTVVVYDDVSGTSATRAWWLLRYCGHPDVRVLDGGWSWWVRTGGPVEHGRTDVEPGDFGPEPGQLPVVDADGAARLARTGVLLDARAPERYRGETEPVDPVAGHIPGAVNVPAARNLIPPQAGWAGRFLMQDDLYATYSHLGIGVDTEVGVYCGSGVTATHDVFALELIGKQAALYPGSWSEWVRDDRRAVETGAPRKRGTGPPTSARP
jgi:thiosulfate/3-mercaptopyruvate sulfurtransferase